MFTRFSALVLASSLVLTGCAAQSVGDADEDPSTLQASDALSAFGAKLVGQYRAADSKYPVVSLNKDDTYTFDTGIRCIAAGCASGDAGRWAVYINVYTGVRYVQTRSFDGRVTRWFRVASTTKLVGAFGTTGTYNRFVDGACTANTDCALGEQCEASACVARALCVQIDGVTTGRVMAKNFAPGQYAEANAWGDANAQGGSWGLSLASCNVVAANYVCTEEYAPVCGVAVNWTAARTFGNACELKRAVIAEAGEFGEATASSTQGACATGTPTCATYWLRQDPASPVGAYYVKTVASVSEANAWIALQSGAVDGTVLPGACTDSMICTKEYAPVCGGVRSNEASTFSNKCMFEASVRASSATDGWSKGYISAAGECTGEPQH